jgi:hypothetical protein
MILADTLWDARALDSEWKPAIVLYSTHCHHINQNAAMFPKTFRIGLARVTATYGSKDRDKRPFEPPGAHSAISGKCTVHEATDSLTSAPV